MSFPRYPDYKDSGVEWLGEVPGHWALKKIKHVASFSGGGTPSRDNMVYWNGDIPWVSPKDMKAEEIKGAEECISEEGLAASTSNLIPAGTVLMVVRSGILKHTIPIAINCLEVALNQDMKALTFQPDLCLSRFFLRWVQGLNNELLLAWAKQGATVESLEQVYLANTAIPLPSLSEQSAITTFLDRETAKIDALVAEQEKLIELLKEKRQAVISHAVTKGLDPSVPMKDSGIEWLGKVPAHWGILRLKHIASDIKAGPFGSSLTKDSYVIEGYRVYGQEQVIPGDFSIGNYFITSDKFTEMTEYEILTGDILISCVGTFGKIAVVPPNVIPGIINPRLIRLRCLEIINPAYVTTSLKSSVIFEQFSMNSRGGTMGVINIEILSDIIVPMPPADEQEQIVAHLDAQTAKFDALTAEAQRAIDLLKEHRSALISAAVTGKIDVRGLVTATEAA